jgi:hypothetical protein
MGSLLLIPMIAAGVFSVGLGIVHLAVPVIFRFEDAIGPDDLRQPALTPIGWGPARYALRRRDLVGVAWVMSNAASYVLVSIGLVDLLWAGGATVVPVRPGALWIAGWWAIRAAGQLAVGRRRLDVAIVAWFAALAALHVVFALA